ncbi:hypothetical protein VTK26DRAFT_7846 [Humicola hyalothermophila]
MPPLRPRKRPDDAPATTPPQPPASTTATSASVPTVSPSSATTLKKRALREGAQDEKPRLDDEMNLPVEERPMLDDPAAPRHAERSLGSLRWAKQNQWIFLALASGACAACNGVFAKLTTTKLTTSLSVAVARTLGLEGVEGVVEILVRGAFFGLNLAFNGVMWTLFTAALARGNSTTQVSIMNTSSNFVITAILGLVIFSESLPPLWWLGAAMLVAGNVIIGRKDEGVSASTGVGGDGGAIQLEVGPMSTSGASEDEAQLLRTRRYGEGVEKDEDVLDLGSVLEEVEG